MDEIDRFSLVKDTFQQQKTEKIPYALWKHFPEADKTAEGLASAQLDFQRKFNSDLMKISPHGNYCVVDFGGVLGDYRPVSGSRICDIPPISSLSDWETLEPVDPNDGEFGVQIKAVKLIHQQVENVVPTMMTIFSPFMVASKLDPSLLDHISQDRELINNQIGMLSKLTNEFAGAVLDAEADGLFIASQHFNATLQHGDLKDFEFHPMKSLLLQVVKKSDFNVLHLHGEDPYFKLATELPHIHAINWHDQRTSPSLKEARQIFNGGLLGGIDEMNVLRKGNEKEIQDSIKNLFGHFERRGLIFSPGCVLPQDVSDEKLKVIIDTINSLSP